MSIAPYGQNEYGVCLATTGVWCTYLLDLWRYVGGENNLFL